MIFLEFKRIETVDDAKELLQMAIELEFSTLPPYLYALYSIRPDANAVAADRIKAVAMEEMVLHVPSLATSSMRSAPTRPSPRRAIPRPLPGGISGGGKEPLIIHLYLFSKDAMAQAMANRRPSGKVSAWLAACPRRRPHDHRERHHASICESWRAPTSGWSKAGPTTAAGSSRGTASPSML